MKQFDIPCDEARIQSAVRISKAAFLEAEAQGRLSHVEFLHQQGKFIRKRWWLLQGGMLIWVCWLLTQAETEFAMRRLLALSGSLFGILILPEVWKSRSFDALEIEGSTLYSLRALYAARLTLFAGVDLLLLTVFFLSAGTLTQIALWDMTVQFLLPFSVTCCICFRTLYSRHIRSEAVSMLLCALWTGVWTGLTIQDGIYSYLSTPLLVALLAAAIFYLCYIIRQGQRKWRNSWEVQPIWN